MLRPLHTLIRNLSDRALILSTEPQLYIGPRGERELDFDPFTRWQGSARALEVLLIAVRKGEAQIVYKIDPQYATCAAGSSSVRLSMNAERVIGVRPPAECTTEAPKHEAKQLRKVPFGKTFDDVAEDSTSSAAVPSNGNDQKEVSLVSPKLDPALKSETVVLKEASAVDTVAEATPAKEEAAPATVETTKKRRSKKAVTTL